MNLLTRVVAWRPGFVPLRTRRPRRRTVPRRDLLPRIEEMEVRLTLSTLPAGFTETTVVSGLSAPTAMDFGPDGMLYADTGDNLQTFTQGGNTYRVSQSLSDLLGKQLRIDVSQFNLGVAQRDDTTVGHLIPPDNPFVGTASGINQLIYVLG